MNRIINSAPYLVVAYFFLSYVEYLNLDQRLGCCGLLLAIFLYYGYKDNKGSDYEHLITNYEEMSYNAVDILGDDNKKA
jgi:hypothetical protein